MDFMSLTENAEVVEFIVSDGATIAKTSIEQAVDEDLLSDEMLIIGIERDGEVLTPQGKTVIQTGDVVTLLSKSRIKMGSLKHFGN